jgi:hypothetical protein
MIEIFSQHDWSRSKKVRSRGGFQSGFPLYHMNRHYNSHAGKPKTESKP